MSVLFSVGSLCFAVAAIAAQWARTSRPGIDVTFFVGSIFFTSASYLQYAETVNVRTRSMEVAAAASGRPRGSPGGSTGWRRRSSSRAPSSST